MVLFAWKESFCTGIDNIDNQHRQFFYLLNDLDLAIEQRRDDELLDPLLRELDRYIRVHIATEEKVMEGIGYPDLPRHRQEHAFFVSEIKTLHERHEGRDARVGTSALLFMRDWFTNHVLTEDRKYSEFLFAGRPGPVFP